MTKPKDIKILLTPDEWREIVKHIDQNAAAQHLCLAPDFVGYARISEILDKGRNRAPQFQAEAETLTNDRQANQPQTP